MRRINHQTQFNDKSTVLPMHPYYELLVPISHHCNKTNDLSFIEM